MNAREKELHGKYLSAFAVARSGGVLTPVYVQTVGENEEPASLALGIRDGKRLDESAPLSLGEFMAALKSLTA